MPDHAHPVTDPDPPRVYQIRLKGHLGRLWTDRFEGLAITLDDNGETLLTGPVVDQAALYGVLKKVRDLGMPLVSVVHAAPDPAVTPDGGKSMKALEYTRYGSPDVLELKEVEKPAPKDNEILIQVRAASVNPLEWHTLRGKPFIVRLGSGLRRPAYTRLGADLAGQVAAVGRNVTQFKPGDEVYGASRGTFAEYVCTQGKALVLKPPRLTFEQAAAVPVAALTALQGLRDKGRIQPGQQVLINGASGGVGTFAVQIAKAFGAQVTAVCSTQKVDQVRSLGADHVVDYTREDFTRSGQRYDLILDGLGNRSLSAFRRLMRPGGTYVVFGGSLTHLLQVMALSRLGNRNLSFFVTDANKADLLALNELMEAGKVTPVIDRCYTLDEAPQAIRYLGEGHARGKVIITMGPDRKP